MRRNKMCQDKKMVPSDPSISSFPDWYTQSEHGIRLRCDVSPLLPAAAFIPLRIDAPVRVRSRSGRSPPLDAAFHSPAATADLSIRPRGRVDAPGLHLRSDSEISAQPVRPLAPALAWLFVALPGTFNARSPLPSPNSELPVCHPAFAPLQDFSILRDRSTQPSAR